MGIVADAVVVIGGDKVADILNHVHAGLQAGLGLSGVGSGQDADDLAGQLGVGVGGAGVEALGVDNLAVGLLGGLVQGGVGHIVAVGSNDGQGLLVRGQAQLLRHVGSHVGDNASRQYMCGQRIAFHIDFPPCSYSFRSVPLAFLSSMILMISAMWAPASAGMVPARWMLDTTVRRASGMPTVAL